MRLVMMGDSIMQTNNSDTYPQIGWGQVISNYFKEEVEVYNFAKNGCSTKSFYDLGYFDKALAMVNKETYVIIEFGHNDEKIKDPLRYTVAFGSYQEYLKMFCDKVKENGGIPILLTSVYRRHFTNGVLDENVHLDYPLAMINLAKQENIYCIDMCRKTYCLLKELGDEKSKELFMNFDKGIYDNYPDGKTDNSHLRYLGASKVCELFIEELKKDNHPLVEYLK